MSEPVETEASPEPAAETATPSSSQSTAPGSDLDSILADFEAATAAPKPAEPLPQAPAANAEAAKSQGAFDPLADWESFVKQKNLEGQVSGLALELEAARERIDQHDFERIVSDGERHLRDAGFLTPKEFVREKLKIAAYENPRLRAAFDNRSSDPRTFGRELKKAQYAIYESARQIPDRDATDDRAAVVHAMRGSTTKASEEKPPDYGSMSKAEFAKELSKHGIF